LRLNSRLIGTTRRCRIARELVCKVIKFRCLCLPIPYLIPASCQPAQGGPIGGRFRVLSIIKEMAIASVNFALGRDERLADRRKSVPYADSALQTADRVFRMRTSLYRDLGPEQVHESRGLCEVPRSVRWYQLDGAMIMDRRSINPTCCLDYLHLVRLYERFSKCPFSN
jgi:hypothetical protein